MIIDNIIVIIVAIILITYLSINYVKKYAPANLIFIAICAFSLGVYLPVAIYDVHLRIRYQIPLGFGLFILPCIYVLLQYNNIAFSNNLLIKRAEKCYENKKYVKCITILNKLIVKDGRRADAIFLLARCYYAIKEYTQAKEFLYEVIEKDSTNHEAYFILGSILEKENDIDSAIDMYEKTLEIEPSCYEAYEDLGILLASDGKLEEAENLYKKAIEYHAESYELLYNLAMIELELGKTEDAEKNLEFALVINPDIPQATYSLGNIKMLKGNYNEALSLYSEITKNEEYGLKAYYKIAIIYVTKNEFEKAMSVIEYLVSEDRNYVDIIENEFVFNAMRSKIDVLFKKIRDNEEALKQKEQEQIDTIKASRKSWFSKEVVNELPEAQNSSILYNDIDMSRTGFATQDVKIDK